MARKPALPGVDRRQQILEAALEVFAEEGFDGATTKDIAKRADVTHGLIYFYFDNKEELFLAAFEQEAKTIFSSLDFASALESDAPPEVELTAMLTRFLRALVSTPAQSIIRLMMHMAAHNERDKGPLRECKGYMEGHVRTLVAHLREYLDGQVAKGLLRPVDTRLVATLMLGSVMTLFRSVHYGLDNAQQGDGKQTSGAGSVEAIAAAIVDTFLHGVLAAPDAQAPVDVQSAANALRDDTASPGKKTHTVRAARVPHTADAVLSVSEG